MRNPWRRIKSVPLGQIFNHCGGGGHQRVASVLVKDTRETKRTLDSILTDIRNAENGDLLHLKETVTGD
jgi:nanoRNase/pAp phosphatase (c-di-AMP/oligoRNAs hydrolase)